MKFIAIDLEEGPKNPVERLREITQEYNSLDELDIEMTETRQLLGALGQASRGELDYKNDIYEELFSE